MKKTIQKKVSAIVWGIILFAYIALAFFYREIFVTERNDYRVNRVTGDFEISSVEEVDGRMVLIFLVFLVLFLVFFINSLLWKLEYDDEKFSMEHAGIHELEYRKITSVVHYRAHKYRGSINEFIIHYSGMSEFGTQEEAQKAVIKNYPFSREMKEFFSFVREKNPAIDFHCENAGYEGMERKDFDFFAEAEDKDTFAEMQTE